MNKDHRRDYHRAWAQITPPLRPPPEVVAEIGRLIGRSPGRTLLLGVTPEFVDLSTDLVALDRNISMVLNVWPGNSSARRAVVGDWRKACFMSGAFSACIGDGCLGAFSFPDEYPVLFAEINRILQASGKFVCRFFAPPQAPETVSDVKEAAMSGTIRNFHTFKFRLGMALAAQQPGFRAGVDTIFNVFSELFEDRTELARLTGWDRAHIDTIDHYKQSTVAYHFPPREAVLSIACNTFSKAQLVSSGAYEMAELAPLLVVEAANLR
jgi:hypothetical protein